MASRFGAGHRVPFRAVHWRPCDLVRLDGLHFRRLADVFTGSIDCDAKAMKTMPNQVAALERRDCALVSIEHRWRGVGEPQR